MSKELTIGNMPNEVIEGILFNTGLDFISISSFMMTCKLYREIGFDGAKAFISSNYRVRNLNDEQGFLFFAMMQFIEHSGKYSRLFIIKRGPRHTSGIINTLEPQEFHIPEMEEKSKLLFTLLIYNTHLSALVILARNPMILHSIWQASENKKLLKNILNKMFMNCYTEKMDLESKLTGSFDSDERPVEAISWMLYCFSINDFKPIDDFLILLHKSKNYSFPIFRYVSAGFSSSTTTIPSTMQIFVSSRKIKICMKDGKPNIDNYSATLSEGSLANFCDINLCLETMSLPMLLCHPQARWLASRYEEIAELASKIDFKYKNKDGKTFVDMLQEKAKSNKNAKELYDSLPKL